MTPPFANREQALDFLYSRINYERTAAAGGAARCFKLDRMRELLQRLGNPHLRIPAVHVAGTKGKGSTAAMIAAILTASGYRTGLFTSPHIHDFEERMQVDGVQPPPEEFTRLANRVAAAVCEMDAHGDALRSTYFEIATAIAWLYYEQRQADVVLLEVGLGGRLDATNLCCPLVTVITSISFDHTAVLGNTLAAIAGEKAGIIKREIPVLCGPQHTEALAVIREAAALHQAPLHEFGRDFSLSNRVSSSPARRQQFDVHTNSRAWPRVSLPLVGEHQAENAAVALAAVDLLDRHAFPVPPDAARSGLETLAWPLRIEVLRERPTVVVDAAHNVASAAALVRTLAADFPAERSLLVFAATRDKDIAGMLQQLHSRFETIILTRYTTNPRAASIERQAAILEEACGRTALCAPHPHAAWELSQSLATPESLICLTGSFFLAAEMRQLLAASPPHRLAATR